MIKHYTPDLARVRISSDKLWEVQYEVTIVEHGINYMSIVFFREERNTIAAIYHSFDGLLVL